MSCCADAANHRKSPVPTTTTTGQIQDPDDVCPAGFMQAKMRHTAVTVYFAEDGTNSFESSQSATTSVASTSCSRHTR